MSRPGDLQGPPGVKARIFLECTTTWTHGGNTGIQRVVRNFINHVQSVGWTLGIVCQPVIWESRRWRPIAFLPRERAIHNDEETLPVRLQRHARKLAEILPSPLANIVFDYRVKDFLRSAVSLVCARLKASRHGSPDNDLQFQPGDILFLLDSSWHVAVWPGVSRAKRQGARVGIMLYDLVPVLLPEMCVPELAARFRRWIGEAVRHADFFVCISRTAAEECRRNLELRFPDLGHQKVAFGSIRLGAELDLAPSANAIRPAVRELFPVAGRPGPYLSVGTIEPRKNHRCLLDAFDLAWTQGADATLCIVGRKGWKCDHVLKRIERHPQLGRRLFMFNDLSDGELKYCYGKARAFILSSLAEGFGLPVVEALSLGCRVWASDIPVLREVGGEYCLYFDPGSPQSLAALIMSDERGELAGPIRPLVEFRWPTWRDSCRELLEKILELVR